MASAVKIGTAWAAAATAAVLATVIAVGRQGEEPAAPAATEQNLFPFVRSLQDTYPDGALKVDGADALVADAELRRMFDYYLAAIGEKSVDEIRAEIERELERRLKPGAAAEAKRLLARYLDYKRELVAVEKNPQSAGTGLQAIRQRFAAMQQARNRFFSTAESQAMFGFDDAYDMDALARLEVSQDPTLGELQKREKLAALDAALPPALREAQEAPLQIVKLEQAAQKMREEGASDDEVYRMRAAALSPEAAARLAEADQEDAAWKSRIGAYLAERSRLLQGSAKLSQQDQEALLLQLRQARFSADEQKRLAAYE
jgi:lipase chaperone LimK